MTLKKALLRGLLFIPSGIFISVTITMLISLIKGQGEYYSVVPTLIETTGSEMNAFVLQYILSGTIGFVFAAASAIFEVEHWSFTKQTILHFLISSTTVITVAYICHWMERTVQGVISYIIIFVIIYVIIWVMQYFFYRNRIKQINEKLQNK